jgi:hypothetical protein
MSVGPSESARHGGPHPLPSTAYELFAIDAGQPTHAHRRPGQRRMHGTQAANPESHGAGTSYHLLAAERSDETSFGHPGGGQDLLSEYLGRVVGAGTRCHHQVAIVRHRLPGTRGTRP